MAALRDGLLGPRGYLHSFGVVGALDRVIRFCHVADSRLAHNDLPSLFCCWRNLRWVRHGSNAAHSGAIALYKLHDVITWNHIDVMCKIILLTGSMVGYSYFMEFFVAYYGANPFERFIFLNRYFGPYWWVGYGMFTCNVIVPQLFWIRAFRRNIITVYFVAMCVNVGMWYERFAIIAVSLHRDFLPSSWQMYYPTWVDVFTFVGTIGLFLTLFLLFIRFFPMVAMSEVKSVLPEADPHYFPAPTVRPTPAE